jgi:hypothetical protein
MLLISLLLRVPALVERPPRALKCSRTGSLRAKWPTMSSTDRAYVTTDGVQMTDGLHMPSLATPLASVLSLSPNAEKTALNWGAEIVRVAPCLACALDAFNAKDAELLGSLDEQLEEATSYLRPSALREVRLALEVSFLAHLGQLRRSGEPYITHPVEVAVILSRTGMDKETILSGLLHDTVEDTCISFAEIERLFGVTTRKIVEGETKV